jgi:peptidoglycan/LPS O-acetylase OafA/YrhL
VTRLPGGGGKVPVVARERERFVAGDPLRALGALGVLLFHIGAFTGVSLGFFNHALLTAPDRLPIRLIESANFGVSLFFVLSGYLLGRPFVSAFIRSRPLPHAAPYLKARALRLLPAMIVVFAITVIALGTYGTSVARLLAVPALVQVYFPSPFANSVTIHYWTLDAEFLFYLLLPIVAWVLYRAARKSWSESTRRLIVIALACAVAVVSLALSGTPTAANANHARWFPMVMFGFSPGLILAALSTSVPGRLAGSRNGRRIASALLLAALIPALYYVLTVEHQVFWARNLAAMLAAGLIVGAALVRQWTDGSASPLLDNAPLRWLGKRSYSFYLLHVLVLREIFLHVTHGVGPHAYAIYAGLALMALIPLSAVSYRLLEAPFMSHRPAWRTSGSSEKRAPQPERPVLAEVEA